MEDNQEDRVNSSLEDQAKKIRKAYYQHHKLIFAAETARSIALIQTDYEAHNGRRNFKTPERINHDLRKLLTSALEDCYKHCKDSIELVLNELPSDTKCMNKQQQNSKDLEELQRTFENMAIYDTDKRWAKVQRTRMLQIQEQMSDIMLSNHGEIAARFDELSMSEK
jgi:hypothetical protein